MTAAKTTSIQEYLAAGLRSVFGGILFALVKTIYPLRISLHKPDKV